MDLYGITLATGATGLVTMAISGLSHGLGGHAGHGAHGGHGTHGGHDVHAGHTGHGASVSHAAHNAAHHGGDQGSSWAHSLLSPRVLFSLLVGFGAGGLLAGPLGEPWQAGAAILGAAGFESLLM